MLAIATEENNNNTHRSRCVCTRYDGSIRFLSEMSSDRSISRLNGTYTIENIIRDNASGIKLDKWKAKEVKDDTNDRTNTGSRIRCQNAGPGPLYILTCKAKKRYLLTAYFSSKQILCFSFGIDDVNTWRSHAYSILTKVWTTWPFAAFVRRHTSYECHDPKSLIPMS